MRRGHVERRAENSYRYFFDADPDPLTGKRRQIRRGKFRTEEEAWSACHKAIAEYEEGRYVGHSKRTVQALIEEWLERRQHKIKPSMHANYRNYAKYYVYPYIGQRVAQDLTSATFDALYDRLLREGRIKANEAHRKARAVRVAAREKARRDRASAGRRRGPDPKPVVALLEPSPGLAPKTVVNVHRMLHRVWADAAAWRYVKRNEVADANPPRVPRAARRTWTVDQLARFLQVASADRFFALWVLEATTGMRRGELAGVRVHALDLAAGTLLIAPTRVVIDGQVHDSDGKSDGSWRVIALDALTLRILANLAEQIEVERAELGDTYQDLGLLFCWPDGSAPHPDTFTTRFNRIADRAGLPRIRLHDVRHSYTTIGRRAKVDAKALSRRIGHSSVSFTMATYMHDDLEVDREVASALAEVILSGLPNVWKEPGN
jgi:integrase